jgi:hypothetical protein
VSLSDRLFLLTIILLAAGFALATGSRIEIPRLVKIVPTAVSRGLGYASLGMALLLLIGVVFLGREQVAAGERAPTAQPQSTPAVTLVAAVSATSAPIGGVLVTVSTPTKTSAATSLPASTSTPPPPTSTPFSTPRLSATSTPSVGQEWDRTQQELDQCWNRDWPRCISLLDGFVIRYTAHQEATNKLYSALVEHGSALKTQNRLSEAIAKWERAIALIPSRSEAWVRLAELTPVPAPTTRPAPAPTVPVRPPAPPDPLPDAINISRTRYPVFGTLPPGIQIWWGPKNPDGSSAYWLPRCGSDKWSTVWPGEIIFNQY